MIKKWEKIREKRIVRKQVKAKETSTQQTTKTSRQVLGNQQKPQLMILNKITITDNRKRRNKNKNRSYSAVVKGITKKDAIVTSPPVLSCDTLVCNNSADQTEFVKEFPGCYLISV